MQVRSWLPWVSGLVFVAGLLAVLIAFNVGHIRNTAHADNPRPNDKAATPAPVVGKTIPLPQAAKLAAARWIKASVGRHDLLTSWKLTAPEMKQGFTLAQWKSGNIPVVPYPIDQSVGGIVRVNWSHADSVSFDVTFLPKKPGKGATGTDFLIDLRPAGNGASKRWLVYYWAPRATPAVPDANATR